MATDAEIAAARTRLANLKAAPLAYARLWHSERTSQRAAMRDVCGPNTLITLMIGGNRCLSGDTLIEDADTGALHRLDSITAPLTVWSTTPDGRRVKATAYPTPRKGPDPLYTVTLSSGATFTATAYHRVMGADLQWRHVGDLLPGARLHGGSFVQSNNYARTDYHYDLHVPSTSCFVVDGVTHHNTGKSVALAQWLVAQAAGIDATVKSAAGRALRYVWAWAVANDIPTDQIPEGPGRLWVASPTFASAVEQIRPHLRRLAPDGTRFLRWDDKRSEAEMHLPNGGVIVSKCYAQYDADPQTWEGANIRGLGLDEQPNSRACLTAGLSRLVDQRGRVLWALTPLRGKGDWLYRQFINPQPGEEPAPPGFVIHTLHGADNPHIPQDWRQMMLASVPKWQRASRDVGAFTSPEGAIFPFERSVHVVAPFAIPKNWRRFRGIDWGARAPHVVWLAEHPNGNGPIYVYRELWYRRATTEPAITDRQLCTEVAAIEKAQEPPGAMIIGVADSESPGAIIEASLAGLSCSPAPKGPGSVLQGLTLIESLMQTVDPLTLAPVEPRLRFFASCPVVTGEIEDLKWAKTRAGTDPAPDPSCSDHGPDALRYALQFRADMGLR